MFCQLSRLSFSINKISLFLYVDLEIEKIKTQTNKEAND